MQDLLSWWQHNPFLWRTFCSDLAQHESGAAGCWWCDCYPRSARSRLAPRYHSPSAQPMSPIPRMGSLLPPPVPMRKRPRSPAEARVMEQSGSRMCDPDMNLHLHKRYLSEVGEAGASPTARRPTSHMPAVTFASEGAMFVASSPDMLWNGRRGILSTAGCKLCHARSTRISVWD